MFEIIDKKILADKIKLFEIKHELLAHKAAAGQFVIVRLHEGGERIPLTIADFDRNKGTITLVVQEVGKTTIEMGKMEVGDYILDLLGPLGHASIIANFGTVLAIAAGLGIAPLYPIIRELKKAGNKIITIVGARNSSLLFWQDEVSKYSDKVIIATDDGSAGEKSVVTDIQKRILETEKIDKVYAIGPGIVMRLAVEASRPKNISTIVSLNSIMVDGTGMCGGCRVKVGQETKFACVDGPEFEGLDVDFESLTTRQRFYFEQEQISRDHYCKIGLDK
ncbi:MAG: sulfide/dihydroorotate dehydrogenase-like FAD/NAD-binding protein [Candidatus Margulisiibacteriota bacterium]|jgi:ferredoxin--NADP+ reductase